jgi:hypothetical protein
MRYSTTSHMRRLQQLVATLRFAGMSLLALSGMSAGIYAQTPCSHASDAGTKVFVINGGAIEMPVGYFLLVRGKDALGAIRLTNATPSPSEKWFGTSAYESYFQPKTTLSLASTTAVRHASSMDFQPTKGVHAVYLYGSGHHEALIGKWKFSFANPVLLPMTNLTFWGGEMSDHGFDFAPTSACDVSEIDALDPRLHWYRYDRDAHVTLPLPELPRRGSSQPEKKN